MSSSSWSCTRGNAPSSPKAIDWDNRCRTGRFVLLAGQRSLPVGVADLVLVRMIFPRSHVWSPFQKRLIAAGIVAAVVCVSAGIYAFERHYGLPSDSVLVGTWRFPPLGVGDLYFHLNSDHTFRVFSDELPEKDSTFKGVWLGGGKFVYFRRSTFDEDGYVAGRPLLIWRLESITPNELHVRLNPGGIPRTVRRVSPDSASASNQSLQPTAGRSDE